MRPQPWFAIAFKIIARQVRMCNTTQQVRIIATLSDRLLSSYAFSPNALHHISHIMYFLIWQRTKELNPVLLGWSQPCYRNTCPLCLFLKSDFIVLSVVCKCNSAMTVHFFSSFVIPCFSITFSLQSFFVVVCKQTT